LSTNELSAFSHVVLVLVGRNGAGPHDLVRMARQGRIYSDFAESQWYAEPKRLEKLGYLVSRKEPGRTHPRTHYTLTEKGLEALRDWMREPTRFSRVQMEPAWRLLAADLVGEEPVVESLRALRDEIADLLARLDVAEAMAPSMPHRERYLLLNHRLARRIVQAHAEWLDEVEKTLAGRHRGRRRRGRSPEPPARLPPARS
jgi:DNA-binding PadR family transcriptional regulator